MITEFLSRVARAFLQISELGYFKTALCKETLQKFARLCYQCYYHSFTYISVISVIMTFSHILVLSVLLSQIRKIVLISAANAAHCFHTRTPLPFLTMT